MQQVQIISYKLVNSKVHEIIVKIKKTVGTPYITVNWDKLYLLEQSAEWLKQAIKPVSQLLSQLGLNREELQGLNRKFSSRKATVKDLV